MKIKNWDKINGYTYKGYCIVNPIHDAFGKMYYADILNLNLPQKPKWYLELMIEAGGKHEHILKLLDGNGLNIKHKIELVDIRTAALFRVRYEEIIDEMVSRHLASAPTYNSHSINTAYSKPINNNLYGTININNSSANGILNTITTSGTNYTYNNQNSISATLTQAQLLDKLRELQEQIDRINNKSNTPSNPF